MLAALRAMTLVRRTSTSSFCAHIQTGRREDSSRLHTY
jgi:hypothetical protein